MNIAFILLLLCCAGCQTLASFGIFRSKECEDINEVKIFQVLNDGALGFECKETRFNDCSYGVTVFIPNKANKNYYDGMRIKVPYGKCISFNGTYRYVNKNNDIATVPKIEIIDAYSSE